MRFAAELVPRPELAPDYIALAALLHRPDLAAPLESHLHPSDWGLDLHQIVARIALSHLRTLGRADMGQLMNLLNDAEAFRHDRIALELAILARVADLLDAAMVGDAVEELLARQRQGAAA